ncbi:hypothetical protein [Nonomuraea sp. KM90]|uniref:hypothetical protein n=1 Tax=Nonomuraea sp. KM90 TaxID=3457428 RepID=UPI003FCD7363
MLTPLRWDGLPPLVRDAITEQVGRKALAQCIPAAPGEFAARMYGDDEVFVKAIATSSPHAHLHKRERWAARHIPALAPSAPVPRKVWEMDVGGNGHPRWHITAWELINDHARPIDVTGWTADLPAALDAVAQLGKLLTPCPHSAPSIVQRLHSLVAKARIMLERPPTQLYGRSLYDTALNGFVIDRLNGDTLLHANLSARHMLIKDQAVQVVGWSHACSGQAWVDPALLAPYLVAGGHTPEQVHTLLWAIPAWRDAPTDLMAGMTALWTLYHLHQGHYTDEPDEVSVRLADAGQEWLAYLVAQT